MSISQTVQEQLKGASWIRRMFEEGARLKAERGEENVFDFTLGNPDVEPPEETISALRSLVTENPLRSHAYMPNAGYPHVRDVIAGQLSKETGVDFTGNNVLMTVGAAGAMNTALKALLDPDDEVICLAPFFAEYRFYISNHGGKMVVVNTGDGFQPDVNAIEAALTPRTKAIILNTPNNPSGAVYDKATLDALGAMLDRQERDIVVISDEPYRALVYDGEEQSPVAASIKNTIVAGSWSKTMALPGERIGYLAVSPRIGWAAELVGACTFANRVLGYVNAPAIWQHVIAMTPDATIDIAPYEEKRNVLWQALNEIGYDVAKPVGAFYMFPRTPLADDVEFVKLLQEEGVLAVPGAGFGTPGHMRLTLTVTMDTVKRSIPGFRTAFEKAQK